MIIIRINISPLLIRHTPCVHRFHRPHPLPPSTHLVRGQGATYSTGSALGGTIAFVEVALAVDVIYVDIAHLVAMYVQI